MRLPVMVSCRMFCIIGQLVLSLPGGAAYAGSDLARGIDDHGNEQQQHPGQLSAQTPRLRPPREKKVKNCCRNSASTRRHGILHALDVVDDGREQRSGSVLRKKSRRAPQDRVVEIVAQVGDHAEAGVVHQIRSRVIENSFKHGRTDQRNRDHGPRIREMRGHQLLQVDRMVRYAESQTVEYLSIRWRDSTRGQRSGGSAKT